MQLARTLTSILGRKRRLDHDQTARKRVQELRPAAPKRAAILPADDMLVVYTDGSCVDNGKPGARAGYGVWFADGDAHNVSARLHGKQTNQRAELMAAIVALEQCRKKRPDARVRMLTDSIYVATGMRSWILAWRKNGYRNAKGKPVDNADLFKRLDALCALMRVEFVHVKAHSGIEGNDRADVLAKRGGALPAV